MKTLFNFLFLIGFLGLLSAQKIVHEKVFSTQMNKEINTIVITPEIKPHQKYKTVYILHGYSGNPERTIKQDIPDLVAKASVYNTIYILPDGNYNSWYVDSPLDKRSRYKTFIGKELVEYIDKHYPTKAEKASRGILGWSMGGFGALYIGTSFGRTFGIVGSSCGALDFRTFNDSYTHYQVDKVLGPLSSLKPEFIMLNNVDKMLRAKQFYILDCGTGDFFIRQNQSFHQLLLEKHVDHLYIESFGEHDTAYWSKSLSNQLALFENKFGKQ
ncbi:esterase [Elizabethkingia meningoseptica]|uniref:Esterase n=2 Tax=Elizabethkingia meningoseptica TaxID=238 RepID=A0A1V3TXJ3_ELIME|nr:MULTISPECIES: alpha/beta hydrolase-fold protein [Elizabethkingia]AQX12606.1 esterase [Elizabethkingia meningoseptica]MBG0514158.1 esterase family protein [Elizabethkingia meningoseptica]MDE5433075.1 esterase family protein [Elizabethkingia meningoseptica]MDE5471562.1 esterase family protein [Elizabethkingia meningoseptica]MDE5481657.1 esterase family protein [Elizabethkingia meningoseptica]